MTIAGTGEKSGAYSKGLEGLRIVELGTGVPAAYACKLLADLGADTVKVEQPDGDVTRRRSPFRDGICDPEKSGLFIYLNSNKRGVVLDLTHDMPKLVKLIESADILIHNYSPSEMARYGIDYARFAQVKPALVMCSITPFGLTGPHKDYRAYELNLAHGGGWAYLSPGASDRPDLPPLKAFGSQAEFQAGVVAAVVSAACYSRAAVDGVGEHIDLSVQEVVASFLEQNLVHYTYAGNVASRLGRRIIYPWGTYPCRDGNIFIVVAEEDQWQRLVELMGKPEWAEWEIFSTRFSRAENWDALKGFIEEWTKSWLVADLVRECQKNRVCATPVSTMASLAEVEHLHERGFFVETEQPRAGRLTVPGAPYVLSNPWWRIRRPAPALGEHTEQVFEEVQAPSVRAGSEPQRPKGGRHEVRRLRPLEGVRVVDLSWAWAGPFCALQLAHLGAEVIKIESKNRLDLGRVIPIYPASMEPDINRSGYYNQWNQGKKSIALNLKRPEAIAIVKELIARSDVVVDNFATGVTERLGLGYAELRKLKPNLIVASISGFGHTGPLRDYMGYGPAVVMMSGLASLTGYPGGPPAEVGISYGDPNGGIHPAAAICAALAARARTGEGQYIDTSLIEALTVLLPEGWLEYTMNGREPARMGNRDPFMAPHGCYRCAGDDEWVTIACGSDEEWQRLCGAIGKAELANDARFASGDARKAREDEIDGIVTQWTVGRTKFEVTAKLQAAGVAAFPSMSSKDLVEDPHLNERGFFVRLPHPAVGTQTHAGIPWRMTHSANGVRTPAPLLGQHTDEILVGILGYSEQEVERLRNLEVFS